MDISFQYLRQSSVQEAKQNGLRGRLCTTVQGKVVTPVFRTTIFQSWLSFVFRHQPFQLIKVETHCLTYLQMLYSFWLWRHSQKTDLKCIAILIDVLFITFSVLLCIDSIWSCHLFFLTFCIIINVFQKALDIY